LSRLLAGSSVALSVSSPTQTVAFAYYAALGGVAWFLLRRAGWAPLGQWGSRLREVAFALLLVASVATVSEAQTTTPDRLTYLGTGTSLLLQSGGRTAVIDGSSRPLAFLSALGNELGMRVRTIDLVVVTDPRSSDVAGLLSLLDHYRVKMVMDVGAQYPSRTYADWRLALRSRHIRVYALRTGATTRIGHVVFRALDPDALCYAPPNCAGIVHLSSSHQSFLLAAHAGMQEQEETVFRHVSLHAQTLFLGDASRISRDFLHAVRARSVWCAAPTTAPGSGCTPLTQGHTQNWPL
jgi:beta-lactamase superfamily II metal-dependent hydrolase